jgi:tricorn protease
MANKYFKRAIAIAAIFLSTDIAVAQPSSQDASEPSWLRYPSISPDGATIVFTYRGDLFSVPTAGGKATQLTQHEAHDFMPVWRADGKEIAFASDRYGNFDIFTMPASGGTPTRVTFFSGAEYPQAFTQDGYVYFGGSRQDPASNRLYPTASQPELYKVKASGGRPEWVLATPAEEIALWNDGQSFFYHDKKGGENPWRKHHVSSIARDLWFYHAPTKKHVQLTNFAGEDRNLVMLPGNQVAFLSEQSGSFNVYLASLENPANASPGVLTKTAKKISSFQLHPVRFLSASKNGTLCYGFNGAIYTQTTGGSPKKVQIIIQGDTKRNDETVVPVNGGARELVVSPNGKEVAFIARGDVFVSSVDGGTTKRITQTAGQERSVQFSPDGKKLVYASERNNKWSIFETSLTRSDEPYFFLSTTLQEKALVSNENENYQPLYSPDGKELAFIENRVRLKILNIEKKTTKTLLDEKMLFSMSDADQEFSWSPDGKWMLFEYSEKGVGNSEIAVIPTDGKGEAVNLSRSGYRDASPKWVLGGKAVVWVSNRDGLRSYANSGGSQSDVYAVFLDAKEWEKFQLSKEEAALAKEEEEKSKKDKPKEDSSKKNQEINTPLTLDFSGIPYRKQRLTVHSSSLGDALLSKDGETLYYLARFEKGYNLWSTQLRTKETKILAPLGIGGGRLVWDKDQKNIFIVAEGRISKLEPASGKTTPVGISGEMTVHLAEERAYMFDHVWRRTQTTFYTAGFHGAKWQELKKDYQQYLPHIGNGYEFAEMLSELLGELNVSHSGASYSNFSPLGDATASLGLLYDYQYRGEGFKVEEILKEGPMDKVGTAIKKGDIIIAIDGQTIAPNDDIARFLNRKAGKYTLVTVRSGDKTIDIRLKPISLGEENGLLYKRWVRRNQEEVEKLSGGKLGYVHVPGMNDNAYRSAYDDAMGKYAGKQGLVVDTRFNGGGDLVADLAMFLSGKKFLEYSTDQHIVAYEPTFRWTKPSVALANEANYSDGHCFAYSYQVLNLGKLVGMPVPGTCTFAGWELLSDGTTRWGVPPLGVKTMEGKYLENLQTNPDIMIRNSFEKVVNGEDEQLKKAIELLLQDL